LEKMMSRIAPVFPTNTETKLLPHFSSESKLGAGPELGTCSRGFGRVPVAVEDAFAWTPFDVTCKNDQLRSAITRSGEL
jgi:hypothetical protein